MRAETSRADLRLTLIVPDLLPPAAAEPVQPLMLDAFGVLVAVLPPDARTRRRWARQWSRALSASAAERADATVDAEHVGAEVSLDAVDYSLTTRVTLAALEHVGASRLSLHAAGLADAEGRVLALVAASGTGKTTAARILGTTLGYLSDETVSVGADLDVRPYPKPLSVVTALDSPGHKSQHSPDELGLLRPVSTGTTLHRLVVLDRAAGHEEHGLEPLSIAEAIPLVLPQTSYMTSFEQPLLALTHVLQVGGGPWMLRYADITEHVTDLHQLLADPDDPPETFTHHPGCAALSEGLDGSFARAPWHDAVEFEDAVVVLVDETAYNLDHLGATVWLALDKPADLAWLVAAAEHRHGEHPDSPRLIGDAIGVLVEAGLVRRL